jgi:hypothetical protein
VLVVPIFVFGHVKRVLKIYGQIVKTSANNRIAVIEVGLVTLFAILSDDAFGVAETTTGLTVARVRMIVAVTQIAKATVYRVAIVSVTTLVTMFSFGQIFARLFAHGEVTFGSAQTVTVALTRRTSSEMPTIGGTLLHQHTVDCFQILVQIAEQQMPRIFRFSQLHTLEQSILSQVMFRKHRHRRIGLCSN